MTDKYGVQDIMALATAVADLAGVADSVFSDGKVDFTDITSLPRLLGSLQEFASLDYTQLLPEVADLTPEEGAALAAKFAAVLQLTNKSAEATVEEGFALILQAVNTVKSWRDVVNKILHKS